MKVKFAQQDFRDSLDVLFYKEDPGREEAWLIAKPVQFFWERIEQFGPIPEPTFTVRGRLTNGFLQSFVNEAYRLGIKPEQDGKTINLIESELKAVRYHLEDMRKLVFK